MYPLQMYVYWEQQAYYNPTLVKALASQLSQLSSLALMAIPSAHQLKLGTIDPTIYPPLRFID